MELKKLNQQVIVITGATSGIGLATARLAGKQGARLVIAARNEEALKELSAELQVDTAVVSADVGNEAEVRQIADTALSVFGGFDTWVNDAGTSIYGRTADVPIEDQRRLFETNYWGVVYGSLVALEHLRHRGGAIINLGSVLSDRAMPLLGAYSASKHAVKGFTDALRMEVEKDRLPVSVTLVKPASINTPFPQSAENYMQQEPKLAPPLYSPETAAKAILYCAEHSKREVFVGGAGRILSAVGKLMPRAADKLMEVSMFRAQQSGHPAGQSESGLYHPASRLEEEGGESRESGILHSEMSAGRVLAGAAVAAAGIGLTYLATKRTRQPDQAARVNASPR